MILVTGEASIHRMSTSDFTAKEYEPASTKVVKPTDSNYINEQNKRINTILHDTKWEVPEKTKKISQWKSYNKWQHENQNPFEILTDEEDEVENGIITNQSHC